jgi:hypothetical protein
MDAKSKEDHKYMTSCRESVYNHDELGRERITARDEGRKWMCRIVAARYMVSSKFPSHILPNQCEVMSVRMFLRSIPHLAGQGAFDWHPEASCI